MNNEWDENMESGNGILGEDEVFGENRAEQETAADATWQSGQAEEYQQNWQTGSEFQSSQAGDVYSAGQTVTGTPYVQYEEVESSNWLFGIVGALIGSLIGVALWIGIYQTGYISSLGGIVIVLGIIAGYTILGKRFDVKGVVICILLSAIMLFVAQYTAVSVSIYREFQKYGMDVPFKDVFKNLFSLLKGTDSMGGFYEDLAWGYVIVVISWVVLWKEKISKGN